MANNSNWTAFWTRLPNLLKLHNNSKFAFSSGLLCHPGTRWCRDPSLEAQKLNWRRVCICGGKMRGHIWLLCAQIAKGAFPFSDLPAEQDIWSDVGTCAMSAVTSVAVSTESIPGTRDGNDGGEEKSDNQLQWKKLIGGLLKHWLYLRSTSFFEMYGLNFQRIPLLGCSCDVHFKFAH